MNDSDVVIGIDVGTSAVKAVAINWLGHEVHSFSEQICVDTVRPGWNEQHPEQWWEASCSVLEKITVSIDPQKIKAIGLSGQMHSPAFLDAHDKVIRPSILWNDGRTDEDQLGVSYDDLEWAMTYNGDIKQMNEKEKKILNVYNKHRKANIHKMKKIPIFKKNNDK